MAKTLDPFPPPSVVYRLALARSQRIVAQAMPEGKLKCSPYTSAEDMKVPAENPLWKSSDVVNGGVALAYGQEATRDDMSYQAKFPPATVCAKCGGRARLALGLCEGPGAGQYLCDLYADAEGFWPQNKTSFAIYLCANPACASATTLWNQA